ncbi:putative receptor-like protein kinase At3g47110 [Salvia hispanica]|uniref:putative receptor-like protein kinase At3g47110 n=1 Tax=Salvia hispanica TaxID=49212 RepID=UPI002009D13B|nr:putative receptor-like protein kinase At3g47110 [Salvia hispanica]
MMKIYHSILAYAFLTITFQMHHPCLSTTLGLADDQTTLLLLKTRITSDPSRILATNWTSSSPVCSWIGVTCSPRHHRVSALNLSHTTLSSTIPPELGRLSFLVSLDLTSSRFTGPLPHDLSLLHRLKFLSLRNNTFTGSIPTSLSNLTNLQTLDLSSNSLTGEIPNEFGRLQSLQYLWIESNRLSGAIPLSIFNMSKLVTLALRENELSGSLPADMCANLPFIDK